MICITHWIIYGMWMFFFVFVFICFVRNCESKVISQCLMSSFESWNSRNLDILDSISTFIKPCAASNLTQKLDVFTNELTVKHFLKTRYLLGPVFGFNFQAWRQALSGFKQCENLGTLTCKLKLSFWVLKL